MHNYRATRIQRIASDIQYIKRYGTTDILAGIATAAILIIAPILMAFGR